MSQKRISFLFITLLLVSLPTFSADFTLHLVHTNDLHAHLIPFNAAGQNCTNQTPCRGGFARLKAFIESKRAQHPDLVVLDAGDRFSGTVFYTLRKSQDLSTLMRQMNYDAMTLGNHELDDGLSELELFVKAVQTPILSANVVFPPQSSLAQTIIPQRIIERNGRKIGIIGSTTAELKTACSHGEEVDVLPLLPSIQKEIDQLKKQGVNLIILLNHIGLDEDQKLAATLTDVDIIISAHTHSLLSNNPAETKAEGPYPLVIKNPLGQPVLIVSAGIGGHHVGDLQAVFDTEGFVRSFKGDTIPLDDTIIPDQKMEKQITQIEATLKKTFTESVFQTPRVVTQTPNQLFCSDSCYVGEILTTALLHAVPQADIALINAGAIRSALPEGQVTFQHLAQAYPFDSEAVLVQMSGQELRDYLTQGLKQYVPNDRTNTFLQTAPLHYTFDPHTRTVTKIELNAKELNLAQKYTLVMPAFLANGGDGFPKLPVLETLQNGSIRTQIKQQLQETAPFNRPRVRGSKQFKSVPSFENRIQKNK